MKILIMGTGGVGGFLVGHLARQIPSVTCIARGEHLAAIRRHGLTLQDGDTSTTVHPALATDDPAQAGIQDVVFLCTKSYHLHDAIRQVAPVIGTHTLVIPLLNGIGTSQNIAPLLSTGILCDGCIYVYSRLEKPGTIVFGQSLKRVYMGFVDGRSDERLNQLAAWLNKSGIEGTVSSDIVRDKWIKYALICSQGLVASYYGMTLGQIFESKEAYAMLSGILDEILALASAAGVLLPADLKQQHIDLMRAQPYQSTPSLMRDLYTPGKPTEMDLFAGELCRLGRQYGIAVPNSRMVFEKFEDRL